MEVSKLTISEATKRNKSSTRHVLEYIQNRPDMTKQTNIDKLAQLISSKDDVPYEKNTIKARIAKMLKENLLVRYNGVRKATFDINYYNPNIPQDIINNAPEKQKELIEKFHKDRLENIVTPEPEEEEEPLSSEQTDVTIPPIQIKRGNEPMTLNISFQINIG